MTQYQRFLSYLFEYEGDEKKGNCGFARAEVRGDAQRIYVSIQSREPVELLHVFGFYRQDGICRVVLLGQMIIKGGRGQLQYYNSGPYLAGSRVRFQELAGLVISRQQLFDTAYATVWDDAPFGLSMIRTQSGEKEGAGQAQQNAYIKMPQPETAGKTEGEKPESAGNTAAARPQTAEKTADEKPESAGNTAAARPQTAGKIVDEKPESAGAAGVSPEKTKNTGNTVDGKPENIGMTVVEATETAEKTADEKIKIAVPETDELQVCSKQAETQSGVSPGEPLWELLSASYPHIETLPGDDITCLKALPADIGRLPRQNWMLSNNGFLMYSYVKHRYIVFAKLQEGRYELWVPGNYDRNEEFMAQMFGFYRFRCVKARKAAKGDFGYWCVPLSFPADAAACQDSEKYAAGALNIKEESHG